MNNLHPAVKAIILKGNKFLVIKQKFSQKTVWDFPGGRVGYGESPYQALKREVKEETQLSINIEKPLGLFWFFRHDDDQVVCTTFLCTTDSTQVDLSQNPSSENIVEFK